VLIKFTRKEKQLLKVGSGSIPDYFTKLNNFPRWQNTGKNFKSWSFYSFMEIPYLKEKQTIRSATQRSSQM